MTDDLERCESCKGTKKLLVLGGWERSCPHCLGIGWKSKVTVDISKKEIPKDAIIDAEKRRGRPKKGE